MLLVPCEQIWADRAHRENRCAPRVDRRAAKW
jgi:hypothetical protein